MGNIRSEEISKLKDFLIGKKQGSIHKRHDGDNETQNSDDASH